VAAPVAFLLVVTVAPKPSPLDYQALDSPFDFDAFGGVVLAVDLLAQVVTILAMWWVLGRWSSAFAAPAGWNASSCAGSRWQRAWWRRGRRSPWSAWRWGARR
jgi:hypothetical protein